MWLVIGLARRTRPLPATIALLSILIVCKFVALVQGDAAPAAFATAGRAVLPPAQAAEETHAAKPAAAKAETGHHPAPPAPAAPAPPAVQALPAEPPVSEAEKALFKDLRARRTALDARTQSLADRETLLAAAERRLSERLEQLTTMQTRLESLEQTRRERDEANWRGLVKTYEAMRPRDAAAIMNELEQPILMQVLDRMKEAKTAAILAAMQPERARAATSQLAQWRNRAPVGPQG